MPYNRTLARFTRPEFDAQAPESWERRLREISPITPNLAHLIFRKFDPRPSWKNIPRGYERSYNLAPDRPIWALYSATPRHLVHPDKVEQLTLHWSELPTGQQAGRRSEIKDYQHYAWHTRGLYVQPFWILQGEWGGTPAVYSERQKAYLRGSGASTTPVPVGFFAGCPFDERAVPLILECDRLIKAGNRYDELEKMNRPDYLKAEDEAAERVYRETYLDTLAVWHAPAVAFMQSQVGKAQANEHLRPAPKGLENTLAQWKDVYKETGVMLDASLPMQKKASVSVPLTVQ